MFRILFHILHHFHGYSRFTSTCIFKNTAFLLIVTREHAINDKISNIQSDFKLFYFSLSATAHIWYSSFSLNPKNIKLKQSVWH